MLGVGRDLAGSRVCHKLKPDSVCGRIPGSHCITSDLPPPSWQRGAACLQGVWHRIQGALHYLWGHAWLASAHVAASESSKDLRTPVKPRPSILQRRKLKSLSPGSESSWGWGSPSFQRQLHPEAPSGQSLLSAAPALSVVEAFPLGWVKSSTVLGQGQGQGPSRRGDREEAGPFPSLQLSFHHRVPGVKEPLSSSGDWLAGPGFVAERFCGQEVLEL